MNYDDYLIINLGIDKKTIELFEFDKILDTLNQINETPRQYFNKLNIFIDGYDNDDREIFEIPEIRKFMQFLDRSFPYWFYYLNTDLPKQFSFHYILSACICEIIDIQKEGGINIEFEEESFRKFIVNHFDYMAEIMNGENCTEAQFDEQVKKVMSKLM